jgi:hypothetical protein
MNFTSRIDPGPIVGRVLPIVVLGFVGFAGPARIIAMPDSSAVRKVAQSGDIPVFPAVEVVPQAGLQGPAQANIQPVTHWYKSKHWWKKNAPIVGGAAGGALIGGLAGGGKGLLIGGAVGGGGGYAYKRLEERHHRHEAQKRYREQERYRSASAAQHTTTHQPAQ